MMKLYCRGKNFIIRHSLFDIRYSFREYGTFIVLELPTAKEWLNSCLFLIPDFIQLFKTILYQSADP
jgi:hypothetical protein